MASALAIQAQELKLSPNSINEVVAAMTLEEKATFVVGTTRGYSVPPTPAPGMVVRPRPDREKILKMLAEQAKAAGLSGDEVSAFTKGRVKGAAGEGPKVERLGVPSIIYGDGPAGLRIDPTRKNDENEYYCTAFPIGTLLASTWDMPLVERITQAMGNEVKEYGVDILLAPALNIQRSPLCGRNFEYYSEDPLLAGKTAAAYIRGIQSQGVGTSPKHFAVNNQETYRNGIDVRVTQRAMREIYLKAFEIAIKEGRPWTVMSSYNKINGVLASENRWLLTEVLRKQWGFDGYVMTDWWAEENGARQIAAGNDLLMPGTEHQIEEIIDGVRSGRLDEQLLDKAVVNILKVVLKTSTFNNYQYSNKPDMKAHAAISREAAAQGMVLLENDGVLPLTKKKVALFGLNSYDTFVGGTGSGNVNRKYEVSIYEGLKHAGFKVDETLAKRYQDYIAEEKPKLTASFWQIQLMPDYEILPSDIEHTAKGCDVAVFTIGRMAGEGNDRELKKGDYYLSDLESAQLEAICYAFHQQGKKVVVLLNMGGIIDMADWKDMPDAILHTWLSGQEVGNAVADVLSGKVSPCGKLPMTIAARYEDNPSAKNFPCSNGVDAEVNYDEDIFVGYRYFDTFDVKPLYPFGFGLSYTSFEYSNLNVVPTGDGFDVKVTVKNTGKRPGREAVQIYVTAPTSRLKKPIKELKAFAKTATLKPGQSETLAMHIRKQELASWDERKDNWSIDAGTYTFCAAASSEDVRLKTEIKL